MLITKMVNLSPNNVIIVLLASQIFPIWLFPERINAFTIRKGFSNSQISALNRPHTYERYFRIPVNRRTQFGLGAGVKEEEHSGSDDSNISPNGSLDKVETKNLNGSSNTEVILNRSKEKSDDTKKSDALKKRRKLELMWCGRENCGHDTIREKVYGDNNEIEFDNPATGQVMYSWEDREEYNLKDDENSPYSNPRVLFLVKKNDDDLLKVAADAARELTSSKEIEVMLSPEVAAKLKHYFGVDNEGIDLFSPQPVAGFGGNHLAPDDYRYFQHIEIDDEIEDNNPNVPDLICTLGGDGLLMYASMLFPGPCPPILCVAGGTLGFLTPFDREEMVESIRRSLGFIKEEETLKFNEQFSGTNNSNISATRSNQSFSTQYNMAKDFSKESAIEENNLGNFGSSNRICLSMRMRLIASVINREGVVRARFNVLNEIVIDRGSSPYLANLECFCDNVHLTTVQADGIIFSTPTGSTAYSMAAGGSVVHPAVPAILVTPICPHVLSFRSMVFPDHVVLRCYVPDDARSDAAVAFDGKYRRELHRGDSVEIQMSPNPVPTINKVDHSADWLSSLKRNFNFNTRARQTPL